jgi:hypothetical protein
LTKSDKFKDFWSKMWDLPKIKKKTLSRIEHDLPLPMILMGEALANYVKSLDFRCKLASEARTKTRNELILYSILCLFNFFIKKRPVMV